MISDTAIRARMAERPGLGFIQARNELLGEQHMQRLSRRQHAERIKLLHDEADAVAQFEREIQPLIETMRKHFEAEDEHLLSMHPGAPAGIDRTMVES